MRFPAFTRRGRAAIGIAAALLLAVSACSSSSSPPKKAAAPIPTVKGSYGTKPTLTFPSATPSTALQVKVLSDGKGPVVANGELLVADYLGADLERQGLRQLL